MDSSLEVVVHSDKEPSREASFFLLKVPSISLNSLLLRLTGEREEIGVFSIAAGLLSSSPATCISSLSFLSILTDAIHRDAPSSLSASESPIMLFRLSRLNCRATRCSTRRK